MTTLTDTQLVVLGAASTRDDGSILPLPKSLRGGAAAKVIDGLIRRGLAEPVPEGEPVALDSRGHDGRAFRITRAGLAAINADPDEGAETTPGAPHTREDGRAAPNPAGEAEDAPTGAPAVDGAATAAGKARRPRAGAKQATLIAMLRRPEGATIDEIRRETGWQAHTVRGAISGALKKKLGLAIVSEKVDGRGRAYRIADPA